MKTHTRDYKKAAIRLLKAMKNEDSAARVYHMAARMYQKESAEREETHA